MGQGRASSFASLVDSSDSDGMITEINVTPLVDIILVLLIIFMLTANLIGRAAIQVELPQAATGADTQPTTVELTVAPGGVLYLNGQLTNESALRQQLAGWVKDNPSLQAVIAGDKNVPHGDMVRVIDLIRQLGIYRFAINVEPIGRLDTQQ